MELQPHKIGEIPTHLLGKNWCLGWMSSMTPYFFVVLHMFLTLLASGSRIEAFQFFLWFVLLVIFFYGFYHGMTITIKLKPPFGESKYSSGHTCWMISQNHNVSKQVLGWKKFTPPKALRDIPWSLQKKGAEVMWQVSTSWSYYVEPLLLYLITLWRVRVSSMNQLDTTWRIIATSK